MKSFKGCGILIPQAKVSLQTTGLATQLLQIKDQYEYRDVSVERSFSMLRKLLAKDRKFKVHYVKQYMILHFGSCTWLLPSWLLIASFVEGLCVFVN